MATLTVFIVNHDFIACIHHTVKFYHLSLEVVRFVYPCSSKTLS